MIVLTNLDNSLSYISVANEMKDGPQQQQVMYQPGSVEAQMAVINEAYSLDPPVVTIIRLKDWMSLEMAVFIMPYLSFPVCFLLIIISNFDFKSLCFQLRVIHSYFSFFEAEVIWILESLNQINACIFPSITSLESAFRLYRLSCRPIWSFSFRRSKMVTNSIFSLQPQKLTIKPISQSKQA